MEGRGAILACALAVAACARANDASDERPSKAIAIPLVATTTKYANGFELITDEDHHSPTVAVDLSYRVGSRDDTPGRAGLAHLVEHLMFRGSRHVPVGELEERVHGAGGSYNARTGLDRTSYEEDLPGEQLPLALWLESDRLLSNLETVDEGALDAERDVVKNELRQGASDVERDADEVLGMAQAVVFPEGHPYHHRIIGTLEDLDRITLGDVKTFAHRYYVPSNATLAVVGDIDREAVIKLVDHWFGSLPKSDPPAQTNPASVPIPKLKGVTRLEVEADVEYPEVVISWPGPRLFGDDDAAVDEYFHFLGRALDAWLVMDDGLARSVRTVRRSGELGSHDAVVFTFEQGTSPDAAVEAADKLLLETRRTRMSPHDVDDERLLFATRLIYALEPFHTRASEYNEYREAAGRALFAPTLIQRYDDVRASTARGLKPVWFPEDARVTTVVHPVKGAPIAGRLVGRR